MLTIGETVSVIGLGPCEVLEISALEPTAFVARPLDKTKAPVWTHEGMLDQPVPFGDTPPSGEVAANAKRVAFVDPTLAAMFAQAPKPPSP